MRMRISRAMACVAIWIASSPSAADTPIPPIDSGLPSGVRAIDEATYLQRVAKAPRARALDDRVGAAYDAADAANVPPNPTLSWERERLRDGEDFIRFSLPFDFSYRRRFAGRAARAHANAEIALAKDSFVGTELDARLAFLDALYAREHLARLDTAHAALGAVVDALRTRSQQGDTSAYDFDRASLELELLDDERAAVARELDIARLRVGAFVGEPGQRYDATGTLGLPARPTKIEEPMRGSIEAARARERQAKHELDLASRGWVPKFEHMIGLLISHDATTRYGFIGGISAELPIFDAGGAAKTKARAEARRWRSEARALELEVAAEVEAARRDVELRIDQAVAYEKGPATRALDLQKRATVAYREGDRTILELLDVQRTARTTTVQLLKLAYDARRAELALLRALGRSR